MDQQPNYKLLGDAYAIIGGIPEERFNLNVIVSNKAGDNKIHCGTMGCAFGWLTLHPDFKPLIKTISRHGIRNWVINGKNHYSYSAAVAELFGITVREAASIFGSYNGSHYDDDVRQSLRFQGKNINSKNLWLGRVRAFLNEKGIEHC